MKRFYSHPGKNYFDHIERIAKSFDSNQHKICASFHDIAKLALAFQLYITLRREDFETQEAFEKERHRLKTTHAFESAYLYYCNADINDPEFLPNFFSIWCHHSDLPDIQASMSGYLITLRGRIEDSLEMMRQIALDANVVIKDDAIDFCLDFDDLSREWVSQGVEKFFTFKERYSRLILADKYEAIFSEPYSNVAVFTKCQITFYLAMIESEIAKKQKKHPNPFRTRVRDAIFESFDNQTDHSIFLIKAPTGVGKTFIALELALRIAQKRQNKRRIITALPFTSIIDQTHMEYEKILCDQNVLKYHHLTMIQTDASADEKEQFSQKLFLHDIWQEQFIVTTFNQLLFTLFSNHNRDNVRLETLRDSVIIIDEIQNISRVLLKNVSKVFSLFAKRYNIDFIIMSATMPNIEEDLIDTLNLSQPFFYETKEDRYELKYKENLNSYDALHSAISKEKGSTLCVVNTVEKAKTLHAKFDDTYCFLLTTHQTPQHRKAIIRFVRYLLKLSEPPKVTLIATQLIEAGVDLDFDKGYREFAPFASIIQMAGRINREGNHKEPCQVIVFDFIDTGRSETSERLPYHNIDLQEDKIKELLKTPLFESKLLANLDEYFVDIKTESVHIDLISLMQKLEFQTLFKRFSDNFMPNQPWKVSLFIEQRANHFATFIQERQILEEHYEKFEALSRMKELEKTLSRHTISVNHKLIDELRGRKHNVEEHLGRYVLKYGSPYYTRKRGFDLDLTVIEEAFS